MYYIHNVCGEPTKLNQCSFETILRYSKFTLRRAVRF